MICPHCGQASQISQDQIHVHQEETMHDKDRLAPPATLSANGSTRRQLLVSAAAALGAGLVAATPAWAAPDDGISRNAEAIHQEPVFKAALQRIYEALTDAQQFQKLILLSEAGKSLDVNSKAAIISRELGGAFSLFGGYVTGRQLALVPNQRIVQAWRAGSWAAGSFSIARFELVAQDSGTKLVFDHTGFPAGQAEHLAKGWQINYWQPLAKLLT
jgi:activator of HSP90 ATPase